MFYLSPSLIPIKSRLDVSIRVVGPLQPSSARIKWLQNQCGQGGGITHYKIIGKWILQLRDLLARIKDSMIEVVTTLLLPYAAVKDMTLVLCSHLVGLREK